MRGSWLNAEDLDVLSVSKTEAEDSGIEIVPAVIADDSPIVGHWVLDLDPSNSRHRWIIGRQTMPTWVTMA